MRDQKLENLLNLALDASPEDFQRSEALQTGFNEESRTWELIVRYTGDLSVVEQFGAEKEELLNGYGIITVPEKYVDAVSSLNQIEYVEKPKRLFFLLTRENRRLVCLGCRQGKGRLGEETKQDDIILRGKGYLQQLLILGNELL